MRSTICILLFFTSLSLTAQEKLTEFTTTHVTSMGYNNKMKMKFQLFDDSLVMTVMDKRAVKQMEKMGAPVVTTLPYSFEKTEAPNLVQYVYRDEAMEIRITQAYETPPTVIMRVKDSFSGQISEQLYFSM